MKKLISIFFIILMLLLIISSCTKPIEEKEYSSIYAAVSQLFNKELDATITANIEGIVIHAYNDVALIEDIDGKAALRVEDLSKLPEIGKLVKLTGELRKYKMTNEGVVTFKLQDATYEQFDTDKVIKPQEITSEFFSLENNYKIKILVEATGTVVSVKTGSYPSIKLEIEYATNDSTDSTTIKVFSFDSEVKDWINEQGNNLVNKELFVIGYWDKYYDDWEIIPRSKEDIPAIGEEQ